MASQLPRPDFPSSVRPSRRISPSTAGVERANTFREVASATHALVSEEVQDRTVQRAVKEASRLIAAGQFNAIEGSGLYWEAFNQTGRAAQASLITAQVRRAIGARLSEAEAKLSTGDGPAIVSGFEAVLAKDMEALLDGIDDVQMKAIARTEWDLRSPNAQAKLRGEAIALSKARELSALEEDLLDSRRDALRAHRLSAAGGFQPEDQVLAGQHEAEYLAHLQLAEAFGASREETTKRALAYETERTKEIIVGKFTGALQHSPAAGAAFVERVYSGKEVTGLSPEENRKLVGVLMRELKRSNEHEAWLESQASLMRTRRHRAGMRSLALAALEGGDMRALEAAALEGVSSDTLDPTAARALLSWAHTRETTWDNDETVFELRTSEVMDHKELLARDDVTWATKRTIAKEWADREKGRLDWGGTPPGKEARRRIKGNVGVEGITFGEDAAARAQRASAMLTELYSRVDAMRLKNPELTQEELGQFALVQADDVIAKMGDGVREKALEKLRSARATLPYPTMEAIEAAVADGELSEVDARTERSTLLGMDLTEREILGGATAARK